MGEEKGTLLVFGLLVLSSFLAFSYFRMEEYFVVSNLSSAESCGSLKEEKLKQLCFHNFAINTLNTTLCNNLPHKRQLCMYSCPPVYYPRETCKEKIIVPLVTDAKQTFDYASCKGVKECITEVIFFFNDSAACGLGSLPRNDCLLELAHKTFNTSLCDQVNDSILYTSCYTWFASRLFEPYVCERAHDEIEDSCYFNAAINKSDHKLCELTNESKERCYFYFANRTKEVFFCQMLTDLKDHCVFHVANATNASILCESAGKYLEECFFEFAHSQKNPQFCQNAGARSETCWYDLSVIKNTSEFCPEVANSSGCYYVLSSVLSDPESCGLSGEYEEDCYFDFAVRKNDSSYCYFLNDSSSKNCILKFNLDESLCNFSSDPASCYLESGIHNANFTTCLKAREYSHQCLFKVAQKEGKMGVCNELVIGGSQCFELIYNVSV